jgi:uncharacterized RDD family membrane protein YckC
MIPKFCCTIVWTLSCLLVMSVPFAICVGVALVVYYTCLGGGGYGYMGRGNTWHQLGPMPILPALTGAVLVVGTMFYTAKVMSINTF